MALVIKGDEAYAPAAIHEALGVKPLAAALPVQSGNAAEAGGAAIE